MATMSDFNRVSLFHVELAAEHARVSRYRARRAYLSRGVIVPQC